MTKIRKRPYFHNNSVGKGLKILELLSDQGGLSDVEISKRLNANLITIRQLLMVYEDNGYIIRDRENLYDLSVKIFEIGRKFRQRSEIKDIARPHLEHIAEKYNETTTIGTLEQTNVLYLDKIDSMELLRFVPKVEQRITAHHTALGKSILAHLPAKELQCYCHYADWKALTPKTITDKAQLMIRLRQVQKQGFAICDEECCLGLRGIAVAVLDSLNYPNASISIWGPTSRMTPERLRKMQADLTQASLAISEYLNADFRNHPEDSMYSKLENARPDSEVKKEKYRGKGMLQRTLAFFL